MIDAIKHAGKTHDRDYPLPEEKLGPGAEDGVREPSRHLYAHRFLRYASAPDRETVHDALVYRRFRFGRPRDFNDPFDCRPHLRLPGWIPWFQRCWYRRVSLRMVRQTFPNDADAERRALADLDNVPADKLVATSEQRVRRTLLDTQQMLCLCGNREHMLMWAYYADRHRGVAIHLNPHAWPIASAMRVAYTNRYPAIPLSIPKNANELVRQFALKKAKAWRHENEYRVLVQDEDQQRLAAEWLSSSTAILPPSAVIGISVGSLMDDKDVQGIIASAGAAAPAVAVFRAIAQRNRFKLDFEQIA